MFVMLEEGWYVLCWVSGVWVVLNVGSSCVCGAGLGNGECVWCWMKEVGWCVCSAGLWCCEGGRMVSVCGAVREVGW